MEWPCTQDIISMGYIYIKPETETRAPAVTCDVARDYST